MNRKILSFGEIMLRLTPPENTMLCDTKSFGACYGGTESNVLVCLSCLGNQTEYLTALPENELGSAVLKHLHAYGVGTGHILRRGDTLGMYFLEEGFDKRTSRVVYNRRHSEVAGLDETAFDYDEVFKGCGLFHISGISFSLSPSVKALCFRLLREAKCRNIPVSFDFNYRSKLWTAEEAGEVYREIIRYVDFLFCSSLDLKAFLGTDVNGFYEKYNAPYLIVRERKVLSFSEHAAHASIFQKTAGGIKRADFPETSFQVLERIGSGDAFAGGVLHGLLKDRENIEEALRFGMTAFILKHTVKGDVCPLDEGAISSYMSNLSKDVMR